MAEDEPFDAGGGGGAAPLRTSSGNAPPSFAFDHSNTLSTAPGGGRGTAPPPPPPSSSAFASDDMQDEGKDGMSSGLNDRWKQYETTTPQTQLETHRNESSLQSPPLDAAASAAAAASAPRQPYSIRKSPSYDTDQLIRKYGGVAGVPPPNAATAGNGSNSSSSRHQAPITVRPSEVRDQAQKVLSLVDDHLNAPVDIRRTESGGFRAAPPAYQFQRTASGRRTAIPEEGVEVGMEGMEDPYQVRRSASLSAKRVPAALSGLNMGSASKKPPGRYTFSDASFRDDDHMSDEEDNIIGHHQTPFQDEPMVDVVRLESRSAGSRAPYQDNHSHSHNHNNNFDGDFQGGSKAWSSRYSDTSAYVSQKHVLDQWDREFEQQNAQNRTSARNMFMSTASSIRTSASNVVQATKTSNQKIFGSGGFSFRANHVFGGHHHKTGSAGIEKTEVNLRTVWKEVDDELPVVGPPRIHKTWQEVMLNKRKRRRIAAILVLCILGAVAASSAVTAMNNRQEQNLANDIGETVSFYVTSDSPYDQAAEERLVKDLKNIPHDSEFVMHLGNLQEASTSMCPRTRHGDIASLLLKSPLPVFVVPGEEDWTKCPRPEFALQHWMDAFTDFDLQFKHGLDVKRDLNNNEAFAFVHKGVLFMGLHIVSGPLVEDDVWVERQKEMLKFYFGMANLNEGQFRSIVLMGNARPGHQQTLFFNTMFSNLKDHGTPLVYIHANHQGDEVMEYNPFANHPEVQAIGVQHGSSHPPLKITVGSGQRPFMVG